jgi:hypothetical protein
MGVWVKAAWRRRWLMLSLRALVMGAGVLFTYLQKPVYEATALMAFMDAEELVLMLHTSGLGMGEADNREFVIEQFRRFCDHETAQQATHEVLRRQPDVQGIVLTDNFLTQAILNALQAEGRRPGADVRVIGHGDAVFADQCRPRLSHYGLRLEEQVRLGTDALLEQIQGSPGYQPLHALLPPDYIARET